MVIEGQQMPHHETSGGGLPMLTTSTLNQRLVAAGFTDVEDTLDKGELERTANQNTAKDLRWMAEDSERKS
jgi:hypothetical protein